jgi:hypothetical protein
MRGYSIALEVDHALVDEIRCNAESDGADVWSDGSPKYSSNGGWQIGLTGAVDIAESRSYNLEAKRLRFAFTYFIPNSNQ